MDDPELPSKRVLKGVVFSKVGENYPVLLSLPPTPAVLTISSIFLFLCKIPGVLCYKRTVLFQD